MKKLIYILAALTLGIASMQAVSAASARDPGVPVAPAHVTTLGVAKDTASMDALVQSLQPAGMVKVGFVPNSRSRVRDGAAVGGAGQDAISEASTAEQPSANDGRMLVAGLVLIGVIAIRRIRG